MNSFPDRRRLNDPDKPRAVYRPIWAALVPVAVGVLCYANALPNDYCFDDVLMVRDNPHVTQPGQWPSVLTEDYWAQFAQGWKNRDLLYRPVSLASYRVVWQCFGSSPLAQHLVNVLLHALVCALVVLVAIKLEVPRGGAVAAGCVFAVLPIHVEAVASVVGRADLLVAAGMLGAVLAHTYAHARPRHRWVGYLLTALCCFVAMGAKESGVTVVPVLVVYDLYLRWRRRDDVVPVWREGLIGRVAAVAVPLALYLGLRLYALGGHLVQAPPQTKTVNVLVDAPTWQHALGVVQLWGMYWVKSLWPAVLTIKYSINDLRLATSVLNGDVLLGLLVLGVGAFVVVRAWRKGSRGPALAAAALVLTYFPTSNAWVLMQVFFAERIWYVPSIWMCILVAMALRPRRHQRLAAALVAAVVIAMAARSIARNAEWRNNDVLYAAAYRDAPHSVGALQLYGDRLVHRGEVNRGIELLRRAVDIDLGFTDAQRSLGRAFLKLGDLEAAVEHLQIAAMQAPGHEPTEKLLADVSAKLAAQRLPTLEPLRVSAETPPYRIEAAVAWIRAARAAGQLEVAFAYLKEHDADFQNEPVWQYEYAVTLVLLDRVDDAIARYRRAIDLRPDDVQWLVETSMLLLEQQRVAEAERLARRAAKLAPDAPRVLACQAEIAVQRGDVTRAVTLFKKAVAGLPKNAPLRRVFIERAKVLGATDID